MGTLYDIPVIILAGGKATRIDPGTGTAVPLVLAHHEEKPILHHVIHYISTFGFKDLSVYVSFGKEDIKKSLDSSFPELHIKYLEEEQSKGTASPLLLLMRQGRLPERCIVVYGDNLFMMDFEEMVRVHERKNAVATIALTALKNPQKYGTVCMINNRVLSFYEKMTAEELGYQGLIPPYRINAGYYVFEKGISLYLERFMYKENVSLEKDIFPLLIADMKLAGYTDDGLWIDVDNPETYPGKNFEN